MPWAFAIRRQELTTRGRDYQLIPTFPRLPGIIPEDPAQTALPSRGDRYTQPSVLSKNHAIIIAYEFILSKWQAKNICARQQLVNEPAVNKPRNVNKFPTRAF